MLIDLTLRNTGFLPDKNLRKRIFTIELSLRFLSEQRYITHIADLILMNGPLKILRQKNKNKKQKQNKKHQIPIGPI